MSDQVPTAENVGETLERIIRGLADAEDGLPEESIREAQRHCERITPRLIQLIEDATRGAAEGNPPEDNAHFFALFLLAESRAPEALPAIIAAVSLPDRLPFELFGDSVTEDLSRILAIFAGDDSTWLDDLIGNQSLNEFVRWAAAQALRYLVRDDRLTRAEAVERLHRQLRAALEAEFESVIIDGLISELISYSPREAVDTIREAYQRGWVDETIMSLDDVEECLADGPARVERELGALGPTAIEDTVDELSWWNSLQQDVDEDSSRDDFDDDMGYEDGFEVNEDHEEYDTAPAVQSVRNSSPRIGRNSPCPCGSGKKFKRCCWGKYEPDEF